MKQALAAILLFTGLPASAHRLDEYLQATIIRVEKDRVQAQMYLTPGVAVFPVVLADIDTNADGAISAAEQRAYAERVLRTDRSKMAAASPNSAYPAMRRSSVCCSPEITLPVPFRFLS